LTALIRLPVFHNTVSFKMRDASQRRSRAVHENTQFGLQL